MDAGYMTQKALSRYKAMARKRVEFHARNPTRLYVLKLMMILEPTYTRGSVIET
jgi:hypothetical protein